MQHARRFNKAARSGHNALLTGIEEQPAGDENNPEVPTLDIKTSERITILSTDQLRITLD